MQLVVVMAVCAAVIATAMTFRFISQIFLLFIATDFYFFTFSLYSCLPILSILTCQIGHFDVSGFPF